MPLVFLTAAEYALQFRGYFQAADAWAPVVSQQKIRIEGDPDDLLNRLGVDYVPLQLVKKSKRRPFRLNLMVVGESGLGKTTFINTLFPADLLDAKPRKLSEQKTVQVTPHSFCIAIAFVPISKNANCSIDMEEEGVKLELTVIDTPGFGDHIDRSESLKPITHYIHRQYDKYHDAESLPRTRGLMKDTRVHAVLYFIPPTGHRLKEMDIKTISELAPITSVIPIIAKADTITPEERQAFKKRILEDIIKYDVKVFPDAFLDELESERDFKKHLPFSVIGSTQVYESGGKRVRGRKYRWGLAEVENLNHCDFVPLRELLLSSNMHDVLDICHRIHYAEYRARKLGSGNGRRSSILRSDEDFTANIEGMRAKMKEEMKAKEEAMRQQFFVKVKKKETELREAEERLAAKEREMKADITEQTRQLEQLKLEVEEQQSTRGKK